MIEAIIKWKCDTPECDTFARAYHDGYSPGDEVDVRMIIDADGWGSTYDTQTRKWQVYCPRCVEKRKST